LSSFAIISGDGQTGPAGQPLPQPLVVRVQQKGYVNLPEVTDVPAPGVTIRFTVPQGSTALVNGANEAFVMTDDTGQASVALTNGVTDTTIQASLLPPMTKTDQGQALQSICSLLDVSQRVVTLHVQ
jgi:hypothetical protein